MVTQSSGKKYHGTLTKKLFRDMSRSAMQFLAMFLLCAMGTWCFSGLDANWRMLELSTETPIAQSNLADFWVKGASFGKNDILKLRNRTGVKDVQARVTLEMDCPDLGDEVTLMVHGYDGDMRICTPIIRTGSELSASDTRGCLLEEQFAQAHNLSVGDTVKVSYGGVSLTFFVRGTILSGEYLVTAKNITPQPDIYGYMYVSAKAMAAFPFTEMLVKASSDADLTQVRAEIMNTCPTALIVDKDTHSGTLSARNFVSMFRSLSYLFPVLVFAVAAMIVVNTLTRMIENQRVQMGTLKALGYRDRQIRLHYLSYAIVPSVAGSLLGVLTGQISIPYILWPIVSTNVRYPARLHAPISGHHLADCRAVRGHVSADLPAHLQPRGAGNDGKPFAPKAAEIRLAHPVGADSPAVGAFFLQHEDDYPQHFPQQGAFIPVARRHPVLQYADHLLLRLAGIHQHIYRRLLHAHPALRRAREPDFRTGILA